MFGYIRTLKPELKVREYERYKSVYCSVCKMLGKRYGVVARLTLSYDFTFLALVKMSTDKKRYAIEQGRCAANPFKKCKYTESNEHIEFTCDTAIVLMYHKIVDNIEDESFLKSIPARFLKLFFKRYYKKAKKNHPEMHELISECMEEQRVEEKNEFSSVDKSAHASAKMIEGIAKTFAKDDLESQVFSRFGYCLGRWIYLIDALDDLEKDEKEHKYNPYLLLREKNKSEMSDINQLKEYAIGSLNASLYECTLAYNLIDVYYYEDIIKNILEFGMPVVQESIIRKSGGKDAK